ncbi:hypothetical protein ACLOJK_006689 [Asimina triloba]
MANTLSESNRPGGRPSRSMESGQRSSSAKPQSMNQAASPPAVHGSSKEGRGPPNQPRRHPVRPSCTGQRTNKHPASTPSGQGSSSGRTSRTHHTGEHTSSSSLHPASTVHVAPISLMHILGFIFFSRRPDRDQWATHLTNSIWAEPIANEQQSSPKFAGQQSHHPSGNTPEQQQI